MQQVNITPPLHKQPALLLIGRGQWTLAALIQQVSATEQTCQQQNLGAELHAHVACPARCWRLPLTLAAPWQTVCQPLEGLLELGLRHPETLEGQASSRARMPAAVRSMPSMNLAARRCAAAAAAAESPRTSASAAAIASLTSLVAACCAPGMCLCQHVVRSMLEAACGQHKTAATGCCLCVHVCLSSDLHAGAWRDDETRNDAALQYG